MVPGNDYGDFVNPTITQKVKEKMDDVRVSGGSVQKMNGEAKRQSHTKNNLGELDSLLNLAHETFTQIEQRLSDITYSSDERPNEDSKGYGGPTALSESIALGCRRTSDLIERMNTLLRSIDL